MLTQRLKEVFKVLKVYIVCMLFMYSTLCVIHVEARDWYQMSSSVSLHLILLRQCLLLSLELAASATLAGQKPQGSFWVPWNHMLQLQVLGSQCVHMATIMVTTLPAELELSLAYNMYSEVVTSVFSPFTERSQECSSGAGFLLSTPAVLAP